VAEPDDMITRSRVSMGTRFNAAALLLIFACVLGAGCAILLLG